MGRKVNESLPPSPARDYARAFRARRAAYLRALEQRVSVVQAENDHLRRICGYPPSSRPPLGRGLTTGLQSPSLLTDPSTLCSRDVPVTELDDSQLTLLNHRSPTQSSSTPEFISRPSLQSPSLPTDPSTCSCHVPVTELGDRIDSLLMLLNHPSPTQSSSTPESSSCPSLQSFTRPTNPSTHSHDVPVMERSGRNDSHSMLLTSDICFSSPNTSTQLSPDRPIDAHCVGLNLPPHSESRDSDEVPQQYVYYPTHQNLPEYLRYYSGLPNC